MWAGILVNFLGDAEDEGLRVILSNLSTGQEILNETLDHSYFNDNLPDQRSFDVQLDNGGQYRLTLRARVTADNSDGQALSNVHGRVSFMPEPSIILLFAGSFFMLTKKKPR